MNYPGLESPVLAVLLILLAVAIPVFIIFAVLRKIRKKTARGEEKKKGFTLKSVKQERLEKQEGKKHD